MTGGHDEVETEAVECTTCRRWVAAERLGSVFIDRADWLVSLTKCPLCNEPILVGQYIEPPDEVGPASRIWPDPARHLPYDVPPGPRADFAEADRCYSRGDYTAAAVMARRCLEGMTKELGATRGTLASRIKELKERGELNEILLNWADALRVVGNDAAHNTDERVSAEDAKDALVFAEAFAQHVYTLKKQFEAFQARRADTTSP